MAELYGIVDTAQDPRLHGLVTAADVHHCLFAGELHPELARAAPYLVRLAGDLPLVEAWRREGWRGHWGILLRSAMRPDDLRRHFRRFLLARLPDGAITMFRFYDPRVFRTYLPSCPAGDLAPWFQGIETYLVAAPDGAGTLTYGFRDGALDIRPPA